MFDTIYGVWRKIDLSVPSPECINAKGGLDTILGEIVGRFKIV